MGDDHHRYHLRHLRARLPARHRRRTWRVVGKAKLRGAVVRAWRLAAALAFVALPAFAASSLVAEGACRDGEPNGAYMLRSGAHLRVVGAFAKGRRTGTFVFWDARDARVAVIPYDNERKGGTVALWYAPAAPGGDSPRRSEATYVDDRLHGEKRSWYPDGKPRTELRYEHGELVAARALSRSGTPLSEAAARELAARDQATDERFYATLETLVADHRPQCE